MKLLIDTESATLRMETAGPPRELPLYGREAFEVLSREWVRVGWALGYYATFTWSGRPILQLPEDLIRLQEVVVALSPDVIVETGIYNGGSLLFHAGLFESLGKGRVIGIDKHIDAATRAALAAHRLAGRIDVIEGDSAAPETIQAVRALTKPGDRILVILDSDHSRKHVAAELDAYSPLVTPGFCIIAADGIMRDLTDVPGGDPFWSDDNPSSAARDFASSHPEFEMRQPAWLYNRSPLENNITYWPDGWLWKKEQSA